MSEVTAFSGRPARVAEEVNRFSRKGHNVLSVIAVAENISSTSASYATTVHGEILVIITYEEQD